VKTQKQRNELRATQNKHQSKTENNTNTEINELKIRIKDIKEEVTKIWKISEKRIKQKHKTQWKATLAD
jgi:hypothetical protein